MTERRDFRPPIPRPSWPDLIRPPRKRCNKRRGQSLTTFATRGQLRWVRGSSPRLTERRDFGSLARLVRQMFSRFRRLLTLAGVGAAPLGSTAERPILML